MGKRERERGGGRERVKLYSVINHAHVHQGIVYMQI